MSLSIYDSVLLSVINHVFLSPKLPQQGPTEEEERQTNVALCHILIQAARAFSEGLSSSKQQTLWSHMIKAMDTVRWTTEGPLGETELKDSFSRLTLGDIFVMHVRAQNGAVIVRILNNCVRFEMFEVSPPTSLVMSTQGKLLCSYPGPAVEISSDIFFKERFLRELSSFLIQMDIGILDSTPTAFKAGSTVREVRESIHPRYISELLVGILRGFGQPASVDRITKRIGDEVLWKDAYKPWRRSPLWLVIRVVLQTSLHRDIYKNFILFFHAHVLQISMQRGFPSETLYLMRAKMARRLSKLDPVVSDEVYQAAYEAAKDTETVLQKRWSSFQDNQSVSMAWHPEKLDFVSDAAVTLNNSLPHLLNALRSTPHSYSTNLFTPSQQPRLINTLDFGYFSNGQLAAAIVKDKRIALADFELSVERYLDQWFDSNQHDDNDACVIASCIEQYYDGAREIYKSCPEDYSVMILTIMDLWMTLDKLTTQQCPLLTSYSPEIPADFLHPLLLHRAGSLRRAFVIEEYILQRYKDTSGTTSIFSDQVTESSFAVQYFRDSLKLQQLYVTISQYASEQREKKRAELGSLNERWQLLKDEASMMDHSYFEDDEGNLLHGPCQKCQTDKTANRLKIDVHEWPLPQATMQAQLVVFELSPPRAFSAWREITYKVLFDIGKPDSSDKADGPKLLLDAFSGLRRWAVCHKYHRITIGSTTKSFCDQTHYKKVQIPADDYNVLVNNGLSFKLYDRKTKSWAARPSLGSTIVHLCLPPTPVSSPYGELHSFVSGTHHTSNEVISAQANCPVELSLHEYIVFAGLRSGPQLQWLSIARELSSPSLSFRREEVHTLITQAAWHLGPLSDGVREWHTDLEIPNFGWTLLHELEGLLGRIEANWLEEVTARTLALIISRLLSATCNHNICQRAYALLRKVRRVTHKWISELSLNLENTEDEKLCANLRQRLGILAATCLSTHDVCFEQVPYTLSDDSDVAIAVHCAVIVHDNTPSDSNLGGDKSRYLARLLNRLQRLLHFLEPFLRKGVRSNPSGFDHGIASLWPRFRRQASSNWHVLPSPNSRWISCIAEGGQEVHFNLLTGRLLIGGNPLGRLPQGIIRHSTYASLLGTRVLDVVPADIPDMEFMTRSNVSGYQIFFSLRDKNLTLRARRREDLRLLQFVPRAVFVGDFPKIFVDDYVHWLDLDTGEVEFRPVEVPWTSDSSNWRLNDSELECRNMPGYVIDKLQSCGTMFGLRNQLVLSPSRSSSEMPRRVIIPQGDVEFDLDGDFARVSVKTGTERHVHWNDYTIDTDLGRLTGNVSLHSKLYQCYLHALTSHCLPDPLLGHTGTEESLQMLQSAASLSFQRLDRNDGKLLDLIRDLTPIRAYYPPHQKSMVTVKWNNLPVLSQHHDFHTAVIAIFDHARAMEGLYHDLVHDNRDNSIIFKVPAQDISLLKRTATHNKVYYPYDLQILRHSSSSIPKDVPYKSRDVANEGSAELAAHQTSWSVWNGQPYLTQRYHSKLWEKMQAWKSLGVAEAAISLRYTRRWLTFNAARDWLGMYDICQEALNHDSQDTKISLAFSLSAAIFSGTEYAEIIPLILIFATDTRFRGLTRPSPHHYDLSDGTYPHHARLVNLISQFALPLEQTPAQTMEVRAVAFKKVAKERRREYNSSISENASTAAQSVMARWPESPWRKGRFRNLPHQWFDTQACKEAVGAYLQSVSRNITLSDHIHRLQKIIDFHEIRTPPNTPYVFSPVLSARPPKPSPPSLREVPMSQANFEFSTNQYERFDFAIPTTMMTSAETSPPPSKVDGLRCLIREFRQSRESLLQLYGEDLSKSHSDLIEKVSPLTVHRGVPPREALRHYHDLCSKQKGALFSELSEALAPSQRSEIVLSVSGLWPRITPRSLLRELSRDRVLTLTDQWKHAITRYAVAFLKYQQSQRLLDLSSRLRDEELLREAETTCEDVAAACSPDWLLIQIDANFLARPLQLAIAREMIAPTCGRSASFQLNMGEGKSSVIVPLVAATLADGSKLARIVTLKPLSNQMYQLLLSRLSGLADRRIFYVPTCVDEGGVLVIQPEHLLSQKLMCIDTLLTSDDDKQKLPTARQLEDLQRWLDNVSRDVLDESDEILHVRYQLVYTSGGQMPVEDHPNRWSTTQQVFSRLRAHAAKLHDSFPKMFELDQTQKGFPTMRILNQEVSRQVSSLIVEDALGGAFSTLSLAVLSPSIREATRRFITEKEVSAKDHELIRSHCSRTTLWSGILLLRGLLVNGEGILGYVLKERRWRVDYGLDPRRQLLVAVPYRAKDVPSLKAEFGHPDVAIALTCLSYYYGGLTKKQVLQCVELLTKLDNPDMEYDQWVEFGEGIPTSLRQVHGINTNDDRQVDEHLVPLFSKNTRVIDFYLSQVVFPLAAKEFRSKLSTSAWDLVEEKCNVTTGFSGTNDNRYLLPTSITQEDPVCQLSTNALVLKYLFQPENNHYECTEGINGKRESVKTFLGRLIKHEPEIRVLLDVGAQMLELQNKELVRHWLSLKPHISAAIFFNESDHLTVLTRDGTTEPLLTSPFNRQLDRCIVYLDDAHTRGTDLKLPRGTRAAVTLGPKVTKDRLLQGCMRMRQLGKGQSVMFFAPGEVDRRIRGLIPKGQESENGIRVIDILRWAMHETCSDILHHLPHWAQQGVDHHRRFSAYKQYKSGYLGLLKNSWLQRESRTLEEMYEPASDAQATRLSPEINGIPSLRDRLELLGLTQLIDVRMAEEQEREHTIHDDLRNFVRTGSLPMPSLCTVPLFYQTGIDEALDSMTEWSPPPLATRDFAVTTTDSSIMDLTDYLRPVNWVLSSGSGRDSIVIVISPYEANELLPVIRKSQKVRLHIYAPRVTAFMRSFSDLAFYTITESPAREWTAPAHLRIELNLFAGQLYFDNREQYQRVCELLALHMAHPGADHVEVDGFVPPEYRTGENSPFSVSVIAVFKKLMGLRRKGMGFGGTDLGRVLDARPLSSEFESWVRKE
ncbi:hypothetical protein EI94DRAFT_1811014 [Lactarius quietus]|nr:hypothetical protein EI94DRAFT_1811014 [Lactarius quietus]